jgi:hypothetical protein
VIKDITGPVDGVFGLGRHTAFVRIRKRFSITGQVDTRTADGLGVRPESTWNNSQSAGRDAGHSSDRTGSEVERGKPSANVIWTNGSRRTSKTLRKPVKTVAAPESRRGDSAKTLQAENDTHPK